MTATVWPGSGVGDRARRAARRPAARPARRPRRPGSSGTVCSCDGVGDEPLAPAAAGVAAVAGLQARRTASPSVVCGRARGRPGAHSGQRARARAPRSRARAGPPRARPARPAAISPTISWPGTNGRATSARRGTARPCRSSSAWSEPQMPLRRGRTGSQSGPGQRAAGGCRSQRAARRSPSSFGAARRRTAAATGVSASAPATTAAAARAAPGSASSLDRPAPPARLAREPEVGVDGVRVAHQLEQRQVGERCRRRRGSRRGRRRARRPAARPARRARRRSAAARPARR